MNVLNSPKLDTSKMVKMVNSMLYVFYHDFLCKLKEREWGQKRKKEEGEERSGRLWTDKRRGRSRLMADADGEMVLQH